MKFLILAGLILTMGSFVRAENSSLTGSLPRLEDPVRKHFILEAGYIGAMGTSQSDTSEVQHGFSGGFLVDIFGEHYFNFEAGAFVTQQGFAYSSKGIQSVGTNDLSALTDSKVSGKLSYVGIPILAKINLAGRVTNTPFIIAGVSPQFLVSKDMSIQASDGNGKTQYFKPDVIDYDPPEYDVTGIIGIGGSYRFSNMQSLLLQATYNRGFVPIDNLKQGICNQSFLLTLGFGVDL